MKGLKQQSPGQVFIESVREIVVFDTLSILKNPHGHIHVAGYVCCDFPFI